MYSVVESMVSSAVVDAVWFEAERVDPRL